MPDELQGWKEIAQYLGKSVRAVQRWEVELGLPVHRIKTAGGQSIYARRSEIDEWRARQETPRQTDPAAPAATAPVPGRADRPRRRARYAALLILIGGLGAAIAASLLLNRGASGPPASYGFQGNAVVASRDGRELWRHTFPQAIVLERPIGMGLTSFPTERIHTADLDGDGRDEVLVAVSYAQKDVLRSDEFYAFAESGELRWTYRPQLTLRFRAGGFEPPWYISAVAVDAGVRPAAVYLALVHNHWWPAAVVRLRSDGWGETVFVHSGHLYALRVWDVDGARRLVAAGVNNEYAGASVAVLPADPVLAHSPQAIGSSYECLDCGAAVPTKYFVLDQSELTRLSESSYNRAVSVNVVNGSLSVMIEEDASFASSVFVVSPLLVPLEDRPGDGYWRAHRRYQDLGRVDHRAEECPEKARRVRVFDPAAGWSRVDVPAESTVPGEGGGRP